MDNEKKHLLELREVAEVKDGIPIAFRAERVFYAARAIRSGPRHLTSNIDNYEDAMELVRRAMEAWLRFLASRGLLPAP